MDHTKRESTSAMGRVTLALLAGLWLVGCGSSNSEVTTDGSATGSGGSAPAGSGGTSGGSGGSTAQPDGGGGGGGGGDCPAHTAFTLGVHIILDATWDKTMATVAGSGKIHLWNRAKFTATGTALAGETWSCGTVLPEFALNFAGMAATLGSKVSITVPDTVWDAPTIPKFPNSGTISGWNPGGTIMLGHTVALVGLTMPDPMAPWPPSYSAIMGVDADGDMKPGFTAIPREGGGYVAPPTAIGFAGLAPSADRIYLASRTVVGLSGKIDTCTTQSGTANITFFDSHVIGCRVKGGSDCNATQTDFVDTSRTDYKVSAGVFTSKQVKDDATCADVRAALPM